MNELRIIVAGGRDFQNYNLLSSTLETYIREMQSMNISENQIVFISGTARGADTLGEQFARQQNYIVKQFPANWNLFGKRAGYIRNEQMAKYSVANGNRGVLFAFWDGQSKGTKHMIELARKYSLEVHVINYESI